MTAKPGPVDDDNAIVIDLQMIWEALKSQSLYIALSSGICVVIAAVLVYSGVCFHESFLSEATLLYNPKELPMVVSSIETSSRFLKGESQEVSQFKNQEELLHSRTIMNRTFDHLKAQGVHLNRARTADELNERVVQAEHVKGTDFIKVSAVTGNPIRSQKVVSAYIESYLEMMKEISSGPLDYQETLFLKEATRAEKELTAINQKLRQYQEQFGIIDIGEDGRNKVNDLDNLNSNLKATQATLAERQAEVKQIRNQLRLTNGDTTKAIEAVAYGQDSNLNNLQQSLQDAEKDYATKALVFSSTNPDMVQLQEKINVLKNQVSDQQILTVGLISKEKPFMIKDQLRAEMISRLAQRESEVVASQRRLSTLRTQYSSLANELKYFPSQQLEYARLSMEKKNKEDVLNRLRGKISEIHIQKAGDRKELQVIDSPSLPSKPLFPGHWHLLAIAALSGAVFSSLAFITCEAMRDHGVGTDYIERILGLEVLSVIPGQNVSNRKMLDVLASPPNPSLIRAYQNLALNLKARRQLSHEDAIVASSVFNENPDSLILPNLAYCLAQSGARVVLIDAHLSRPKLHQVFQQRLDYDRGLTELINSLSEILYRTEHVQPETLAPAIEAAMLPSGAHPLLTYINAGVALENTFEFLNSKSFGMLVSVLKSRYDWVLIDAPPFLESPDASILLGYTDGLLLFIEEDTNEAQVAAIKQRVERLNSNVIGVVLRNTQA